MMKVMRLYGVRDLRLNNEPPPILTEGDELLISKLSVFVDQTFIGIQHPGLVMISSTIRSF